MNEATAEAKVSVLIALYRAAYDEMTWRRNAGYRTIILGLAYCGALVTAVAALRQVRIEVRVCLSAVIVLGSIFGSAYLASNYYKYCDALRRMVKIEEYVGAYAPDYLGALGPLMTPSRKAWPETPLVKNPICIWSIIAFLVGGIVTAVAILFYPH
jgi:hypothetical protein